MLRKMTVLLEQNFTDVRSKMTNNLCIIPARGGSSRLKDKNLQLFLGTSLLVRAINIAKESGVFKDIIVSTENVNIKEVALQQDVIVQDRPMELATSGSLVADTIQYVLQNTSEEYDYVELLQANTPLIEAEDIKGAMEFAYEKDADFIISVMYRPCPDGKELPMEFCAPLPSDMLLTNWMPKFLRYVRTQDISPSCCLDGNIYIGKPWIWKDKVDYWTTKIYGYQLYNKFSDIHTHADLLLAERKWKQNQSLGMFNRKGGHGKTG